MQTVANIWIHCDRNGDTAATTLFHSTLSNGDIKTRQIMRFTGKNCIERANDYANVINDRIKENPDYQPI